MIWLPCDRCQNDAKKVEGCTACGGRGRVRIEGCVKKQIDGRAWELLDMSQHTDDGTWPVGGGVLDQTPAYLRAYRWVKGEKATVEAELRNRK